MSDRRQLANRTNASKSTGPQTTEGKESASRNALRHGLRSERILLDGEDVDEFNDLKANLLETLAPVGAIELSLAERIVVVIWRQRRLTRAEAAALALERRDSEILDGLRRLHDYGERDRITAEYLEPSDTALAAWCRAVLDEIGAMADFTVEELKSVAPHAWEQLKSEADEDEKTPETYIAGSEGGLASFLTELSAWCRRQLNAAERHPQLLKLAGQLRERGLVLPAAQLDVMARYQTTLDNQLYKALRAFREAQEWRLETLDHVGNEPRDDVIENAA
ncbi:MAG: hypothetical protein JXQ99_00260 [Hyphomicrobiaceae bacterium]